MNKNVLFKTKIPYFFTIFSSNLNGLGRTVPSRPIGLDFSDLALTVLNEQNSGSSSSRESLTRSFESLGSCRKTQGTKDSNSESGRKCELSVAHPEIPPSPR